jgi:hypothetical protein
MPGSVIKAKKIVFRLIFRIQPEFCHANPVLIDRNRNFEISIPVLNNRNRIFQSAFRFRFTGNGIPVPFRFPAGYSGSGRTLHAGDMGEKDYFF